MWRLLYIVNLIFGRKIGRWFAIALVIIFGCYYFWGDSLPRWGILKPVLPKLQTSLKSSLSDTSSSSKSQLQLLKQRLVSADRSLNKVWRSLPATTRAKLKDAQLEWLRDKGLECRTDSQGNSLATSNAEELARLKCEINLTKTRTDYLKQIARE